MQANSAVVFSPIFTNDKKVEVSLQNDQAVIKLSTWTEDLGWCGQKTLSLDAEMLDELQKVITAAQIKMKREEAERDAEKSKENEPSKILQFPKFL
ncbi:MAG TPA: hypothetical protein VF556_02905 [Pyrinomonadaceae bacterium]|jgi:hypothetical protein